MSREKPRRGFSSCNEKLRSNKKSESTLVFHEQDVCSNDKEMRTHFHPCRQKRDAEKKKKDQNKILGKNGARNKLSFKLFG